MLTSGPGSPGAGETARTGEEWTSTADRTALDRVTDLAARLLHVPSAQVSLLSDVQTVVGGTGLSPGAVGSRTPREDSLCTVTAGSGAPLLVTDAGSDPRVSALPPVRSGAVGSYLGVPLVGPDGQPIGALCVFDPAPREWTPSDVSVLEQLARAVVAELELAAVSADRRADRTRWDLAAEAGGVGAFDLDLESGVLVLDDRLLELSDLDRASFSGRAEDVYAHVHPDDVEDVITRVQEAIATGGSYESEYRIVPADGGRRWVAARGRVVVDHGRRRLIGVASETTAQREPMQRTAELLEGLAVAFIAMDRDWVMTHVNTEAERIAGLPRTAMLGRSLWETFPATLGTEFEDNYRRAAATGQPVVFDAYYPEPLSVWVEVRAVPGPHGVALYFLDITNRVRLQRRSELLERVSAELTGTLDAEVAVARLAQLVVPALADWCLVTLVGDEQHHGFRHGLRDVGWSHSDPELLPVAAAYARERIPALSDTSFVARALSTGRPVVLDRDAAASIREVLAPGPAQELLGELAPESFAALPLRGRGRTVGLLSLFNGAGRGSLTSEDLATAADIAGRAGLALDNARLYRQQTQLAEGLQRSLLTAPAQPDHVQVVVRYTPAAETAQVGGDWYDAFLQSGGASIITVGDVLGHNVEAAAAMGQIRSMLRAIAVTTGAGPAEILRRVDEAMTTLQLDTTATAVVIRLEQSEDEARRGRTTVRWSNAGHPPPMVIAPDGSVSPLTGPRADLLLGVDETARRREFEVTLPWDSTLVLYTDGLIERRDQDLDEGLGRLSQALEELADRDLDELCDELLVRMLPERTDDDVALVAVRLHRQDRLRPAEAGPNRIPPDVADSPAVIVPER
ncbi:SpoIIE family protein phosphatase [Blastococcus sp. LR1]|uniref:SpoIIE family protein phosphatase n=1 Tax=Blastococcus sp. LR1 TaxID=2877000 RepID=UPI001CCD8C3D|nr:SpoIIE family protein phosphatase [Blastococcus sp. LR1]MCA0144616.1 SpoIIE family protein phosphatase [Blastococcus sp. LR1]